jgi:tRNA pseudouridine-54 N-methylase
VIESGLFPEVLNEALSSYRNIAGILQDNACVRKVCDVLYEITSGDFPDIGFKESPFIFLDGSSGTGKSQMAFAIEARASTKRDVYYFLFEAPRTGAQKIYLNFKETSSLFFECCEADRGIYGKRALSPTCNSLFAKKLFVYGFLYQLISEGIPKSSLSIAAKSGKDIRDLMIKNNVQQRRTIFILDECIAITEDNLKKVRFVRNCFRSLGLGLVMLGTDSRAAKLPSNIGACSRTDSSRPWCFVFGHFPPVDLHLTGLRLDAPEWLKPLLQNSRPLFAQLVSARTRQSFSDFNVVLKDVFLEVIDLKSIFGNFYGQLGQLRLFHNAHFSLPDWNNQSTPLIHSHFAQLDGEQKNFILLNTGQIKPFHVIWTPASMFPKVQDDILLYLLLMGGKDFSPFYSTDNKKVSYAYFLMKVKDHSEFRSNILDYSNAEQPSNDGMFLESLLCSTICVASHSNGLQGIGLKKFLLNLVFQLQVGKVVSEQVEIAGLEQLDGMNMTVPFLSPPNQRWPDFLQIPGANLGYLSRARNSEKIDLWASNEIAGESKDYGNEINLGTMKQILERVPEQAMLEIVFTRKLQNSYFNPPGKSFQKEFQSSHVLFKSFYRINASNPNTSLETIKGLPSGNDSTGVVIFFEINEELSL